MSDDVHRNQGAPASPFNRTVQHDAKRAAILSQSARLFNYKGSRATTLQDIAETLGLTKTSLYYYVKTKEELIYQCYMATLEHAHRTLDEIEAAQDNPVERISAFVLKHFEDWQAAQAGRAPHNAVLLEIAGLKGGHREEVEARYIEMFKRLRAYLREGIAQGLIRPCDPTSSVLAILGSLDWTFSWLYDIPEENVTQSAQEAVDLITHGLAADGSAQAASIPRLKDDETTALQGFNRQEQNRLKQEAFFKTGTRCFNKKGFSGTLLEEIAEQLHVSKGAFYYHIKNKEDLLVNCYERSMEAVEKLHAQAATIDGSGLQKAQYICRRAFLAQNSEQGPLIRYNSITALPMERRRKIVERTEASNQRFGEFLKEGIADGSVRPINTFIAQQLIAGAMNAAMDIKLWRKVEDIDSAAIEYFDLFFNGLLPR